jgi:hypothetical protein
MLYSEIIAVCSQIHTKHANTLCGQNVATGIFIKDNYQFKHTWVCNPRHDRDDNYGSHDHVFRSLVLFPSWC